MIMRCSKSALCFACCAVGPLLALSSRAEALEPAGPDVFRTPFRQFAPGVAYYNFRVVDVPWSIHVVRMDRSDPSLEVFSTHASGGVGQVSTVTEQANSLRLKRLTPLAGVNGDFYARDRSAYAGDPRGLQIVEGDLISAPIGGVAFWVDAAGAYHMTNVTPQFNVTWPDGTSTPFGLNQARRSGAVLYTPAMGPSTLTRPGRELVLERLGEGPWLPLKVGESFTARVRDVRETGSTPIAKDTMVLSVDPVQARSLPPVARGATLKLSTATTPDLRGATSAISGGPVLVNNGRLQRVPRSFGQITYEFRSMQERHPRSALGWNRQYFYLIQVDGRQGNLSVGMTLEELGDFALSRLGCTQAMNLDGGVSSALWADGRVRNSPCAGEEKDVANAVVVVRRSAAAPAQSGGAAGSSSTPATK
jgi:hypothetical protein